MIRPDFTLNHRFPPEIRSKLVKRGAPTSAFSPILFDVQDRLVRISADIERLSVRNISPERQAAKLKNVYESVLDTNYILVINSFPSDTVAKHLALSLMYQAYYMFLKKKAMPRYSKRMLTPPLWHRVYNTYRSPLIDEKQNPCMLVLSNIVDESTPLKFDKVRDLLDAYDDVPRILVAAPTDPVTFCARANINATAHIYCGPKDRRIMF